MIHELDQVALTSDLPSAHLKSGDLGTVVHIFESGEYYVVEFFTPNGKTVAVTTVPAGQIRPVGELEVLATRLQE